MRRAARPGPAGSAGWLAVGLGPCGGLGAARRACRQILNPLSPRRPPTPLFSLCHRFYLGLLSRPFVTASTASTATMTSSWSWPRSRPCLPCLAMPQGGGFWIRGSPPSKLLPSAGINSKCRATAAAALLVGFQELRELRELRPLAGAGPIRIAIHVRRGGSPKRRGWGGGGCTAPVLPPSPQACMGWQRSGALGCRARNGHEIRNRRSPPRTAPHPATFSSQIASEGRKAVQTAAPTRPAPPSACRDRTPAPGRAPGRPRPRRRRQAGWRSAATARSSLSPTRAWPGSGPHPGPLMSTLDPSSLIADTKNSMGLVGCIEEVAHNAIAVYWNPLESPAKINVAVQCLSTDFSSQKGVKVSTKTTGSACYLPPIGQLWRHPVSRSWRCTTCWSALTRVSLPVSAGPAVAYPNRHLRGPQGRPRVPPRLLSNQGVLRQG